jgi:3-phenylpropionate/trans-cinnamate dioxygenase ferredoxin reductase subunit
MTQAPRAVTVVGASLAGWNAAGALRREGFDGPVTLIGAETHPPYDRPPLSKQVLAGDWEPERAALTDPEELEEDGIEARLGVRATALDLDARRLTLHTGETVEFDGLVIATGARCRTMPGIEGIGGVHVLRSLDDCLALRADFEAAPQRVVVVGAGFIGAEVAATARGRGLDVTMVEALPTPLSRVLGDEMGEVCAEVHRDHGVDLRTAVGVERVSGDGRVERVTLSDGSTIDADVVVVGIGVIPNTEWLDGSGLEVDDGVVCDASCLAADRVTAAGDVARWPNELFGETMRVEHWDNAAQQGAHAARRLLDAAVGPFTPVPWFWSDQYDRKIQLAGRVRGDDEVRVVAGSVDERRFAAIYGRAGRIVGVLGFNRPRHVMRYRALIEQGAGFDEALAAEF